MDTSLACYSSVSLQLDLCMVFLHRPLEDWCRTENDFESLLHKSTSSPEPSPRSKWRSEKPLAKAAKVAPNVR